MPSVRLEYRTEDLLDLKATILPPDHLIPLNVLVYSKNEQTRPPYPNIHGTSRQQLPEQLPVNKQGELMPQIPEVRCQEEGQDNFSVP
ncbi:hypothetical protein RRG08_031085 [Elysia crispata]|uniref:Uncharacterized protein n=1 Tax=Elysia crispata TaxID=231223 RepID=A0AAE0ZF43_9GAST|nr:hypothetical protein RRG08_031085 [Elysia crispata]